MKSLTWMVFGTVAGLAGCGSDLDGPVPNPMPVATDICAEQRVEETSTGQVVHCVELYAEAPFIHVPESDGTHVLAAIEGPDFENSKVESNFVTGDGTSYPYVPGIPEDPENVRHVTTLYELTLQGGSVKSFRPAVVFPESMFIAPFMDRAFEGTTSRLLGEGEFALEASLPIRIELDADPAMPPSQGSTFEAKGSIANLTEAVTAADGTCMPALSSYGAEAPFPAGVSVEVRMSRIASMHGFGDDEIVFNFVGEGVPQGGLMHPVWYRGPADLLSGGSLTPTGTYDGTEHARPGSIPDLVIDPIEGGGEPCTP